MRLTLLLCPPLLLGLAAPATAAQLYQWKDAQGRTIYSDQAPAGVSGVQQKAFKPNVIDTNEPYASRLARQVNPVTLYINECGPVCDRARALLAERGITYASKNPQGSPEALAELEKLTGRHSVPVLLVGKDKIDGYDPAVWNAVLDRAGYPKAGARKPAPAASPETTPAAPSGKPAPPPAKP